MTSNSEAAPSVYPAPRTQELSLLARKIQQGDNTFVQTEIKKNPRLLASSTDAPTILQEGFRYNALHVAARYGNVEAAQFILATVNGVSFMKSLYPDDPQSIRDDRTKYLTDMYLNTPDKGTLETPLHFACKFSFHDVVKILLGHPLCDLKLTNRDLQTAENVIGKRATKVNESNHEKIWQLFQANRIIPIWRDLKNDAVAAIGRPVNPKYLGEHTPAPFIAVYGDVVLSHFGPVDTSCIPKAAFGASREIWAYAGPTDEETAEMFYNTMKGIPTISCAYQTPPTSPSLQPKFSSPSHWDPVVPKLPSTPTQNFVRKSFCGTPTRLPNPSCSTPHRKIATKDDFSTPPTSSSKTNNAGGLASPFEFEYTPKTLSLLLASPGSCSTPTRLVEDKKIRLKDPEKGMECLGRKYSAELEVPWNEYWSFLGEFVDLSSKTGLTMLEDHLKRKSESQNQMNRQEKVISEMSPITILCNYMSNLRLDSGVTESQKREIFSEDWRNGFRTSQERECPMSNVESQNQNGASIHVARKLIFDIQPLLPTNGNVMKNRPSYPSYSEDLESDLEDIEDDRQSVYRTPNSTFSSSDEEEAEFEDCDTMSVFVNGSAPSKEDFQALEAISSFVENTCMEDFPIVCGWFNALRAMGGRKKK